MQEDEKNIEFTKGDHPKLVSIFKSQDELAERLRKDILLTYTNDFPISISSLNEITTEQSLTNLHGEYLDVLMRSVV